MGEGAGCDGTHSGQTGCSEKHTQLSRQTGADDGHGYSIESDPGVGAADDDYDHNHDGTCNDCDSTKFIEFAAERPDNPGGLHAVAFDELAQSSRLLHRCPGGACGIWDAAGSDQQCKLVDRKHERGLYTDCDDAVPVGVLLLGGRSAFGLGPLLH